MFAKLWESFENVTFVVVGKIDKRKKFRGIIAIGVYLISNYNRTC